ncbi:MAG TPA: T9SS type A sorting domain-containing protein, partial [Flavobacteriales bacterium]|nr:T9SS type A sorting domain-containing protein [Flavobacteriales bacterium]
GTYHLHTLVYDTLAFDPASIVVGTTTGLELNGLLIQGGGEMCGALDLQGAEVHVQNCTDCAASPGSLTAYKSKDCLTNSTWIGAVANGDAVVPDGFQVAYIFTEGDARTIIGRSAEPWWQVTATGTYYIHTLVYDPATLDFSLIETGVTTAADVDALLTQGGGEICAGLDLVGAMVMVGDPHAGGLSVPSPNACLEDGLVTLTATPTGGSVVPDWYEVVYVLSRGTDHVIVAAGPDPSFTVTEVDYYTIHTLVYDPSTLDLGDIVLGTTTTADVNGWLTQGGGYLCGSLDRVGAEVKVDECTKKDCTAEAGCLRSCAPIQCLHQGDAELAAVSGVGAVVPTGYVHAYVLTRGWDLTVEGVSGTPHFTVHHPGLYRIHSLVYDPATLDLNTVQLGSTTAAEVNALLIQGGGTICAALDLRGACFLVLGSWWCGWWDCHRMAEGDLTDQAAHDHGMLKSIENDTPVGFNAWPNPVVDVLTMDVTAYADAPVQVDVLDAAGRVVAEPLRVSAVEGSNRLTLPFDGMQAGTYLVRVTTGDHVEVVRVVKAVR